MKHRLVAFLLLATPLFIAATAWMGDRPNSGPPSLNKPTYTPARGQRKEPLAWGVYQIYWGRRFERNLAKELEQFASRPQYVMFYRDLGRPFPKYGIDIIRAVGATPMISLELWMWGDRDGRRCLPDINAGRYDAFFRDWARAAAADGRRVLLRFGFEMNGNWFSWSEDPLAFVTAWQRIKTIFDAEQAGNVEWVWSPNVVSIPRTAENDMHLYYPGDRYVDWVSLDGYNFGDHHSEWHRWQSFAEIYEKPLGELLEKYPSKPIIISEFGCAPGKPGQKAKWIRDAHAYLSRIPQVKAAIWFNLDKRREGEPNWRVDECDDCLKAFNETFAREWSTQGG